MSTLKVNTVESATTPTVLISDGLSVSGVSTLSGGLKVGTAITMSDNGNFGITGIMTASSFSGSLAASNLTGALPAISGASLTGITAGKILQVVQFTTHSTNNYASENFQNTVVTTNITPTAADSKFLIKSVIHFGIGSEDCATSFNFSDSLHASGTTHPIGPMSTDGTNGASNSRLPAYFGFGSFAGTAVDDFWIGNAYGEFLYTPAYQNTTQRAFTVMVRSAEGINVRFSMNGQYNAANPRDMRPTNSITVMEVGA